MSKAQTLDPARTAVLFFDFLNGHVKKDDPATQERYKPVVAAAQQLLHACRRNGVLVAHAHANHRADNRTTAQTIRDTDNRLNPIDHNNPPPFKPVVESGSWEAAVIDELAPEPSDFMIPKFRWSAFHQTYLDLALRTNRIENLILAGGSTDVGVASTAFSARDLDYNLVIARDACSSKEQDNHDQLMNGMFPRMGRVRVVSDIVAMLENK